MPAEEPEPINVVMVNPAMFAAPAPVAIPQPDAKPEAAPPPPPKEEPKPETKPEPKPEPKPVIKPKPKPVKKEVVKPQPKKVVEDKPREETPTRTVTSPETSASSTSTHSSTSTTKASNNTASAPAVAAVPSGPQALSIVRPIYPARAVALKLEGKVVVRYDVDSNGRTTNVEIISAEPRNLFEREVKQALKKWRFATGREGKGLTKTIIFRMSGDTEIQ